MAQAQKASLHDPTLAVPVFPVAFHLASEVRATNLLAVSSARLATSHSLSLLRLNPFQEWFSSPLLFKHSASEECFLFHSPKLTSFSLGPHIYVVNTSLRLLTTLDLCPCRNSLLLSLIEGRHCVSFVYPGSSKESG